MNLRPSGHEPDEDAVAASWSGSRESWPGSVRRGELLGIVWEDADLKAGTLAVQRTLQKGEYLPPRTQKGTRQVRLTDLAVTALERHRENQAPGQRIAFPNAKGHTTDADNLCGRHFKPLLRRAGQPDIRVHDLRHTCATHLLTRGVHTKIVSEMLRDANISVTLDTYSRMIPGLGDAAASAMDSLRG